MPAILAGLLPQLLPLVASILAAAGAWLLTTIQKKVKADTAQSKLLVVGAGLIGRAWDKLAPEVQKALADGQITAEEREHILEMVMQVITDEDRQVLEDIGKALGIPFAGIIAGIAERFIDTWAKAHDPSITTVSAKAFPVAQPGDAASMVGGAG